jgi:hypothetical protein
MVQYAGAPGQEYSSEWRKILSHLRDFINRYQKIITFIIFGLMAIFAVVEMVRATPFGPAFGSDSVTYMESAGNFVTGKGLGLINPDGSFRLLPYAPPLYPLILGLFAALGLDLLTAAFWMNALLYGTLIILLGWSIWRFLHSLLAAIFTAALLTLSGVLIGLHIWIMSDPLSLALGMGGLVLMGIYLEGRSRKAFLWSAILTGLSFLTRYPAVAYCIAGVLGVILLGSQSFKKRLVAGSVYGFLSVLPMLVWLVIDLAIAGSVGSRSLLPWSEFFSSSLVMIKALKEAMYLWLPAFMALSVTIGQTAFRLIYLGLILITVGAVGYATARLRHREPGTWRFEVGMNFILMVLFFLGIYLVVIDWSYAMIYPHPSLSDRIFAPINVCLLLLVGAAMAILIRQYRYWLPRLLTILFSIAIVVVFYSGSKAEIAHAQLYPPGYTGFKGTGLIEYVKGLPADIPIISDKAPMIQYYAGRTAYPIQEFFGQQGVEEYLPFGSDLSDPAQRAFREQGGALVLFWLVQEEFKGLYGQQAGERYAAFVAGLYLAYDSPEGKVYFYHPPSQ